MMRMRARVRMTGMVFATFHVHLCCANGGESIMRLQHMQSPLEGVSSGRRGSRGLLVQAQDVSCGIAESCRNLGCVGSDGLYDLAAVCDDQVNGGGSAVNHDVNHQAGVRRGGASKHPGAADFADRVVKGGATVIAFAHIPAENLFVKVGRGSNVSGGNFDI